MRSPFSDGALARLVVALAVLGAACGDSTSPGDDDTDLPSSQPANTYAEAASLITTVARATSDEGWGLLDDGWRTDVLLRSDARASIGGSMPRMALASGLDVLAPCRFTDDYSTYERSVELYESLRGYVFERYALAGTLIAGSLPTSSSETPPGYDARRIYAVYSNFREPDRVVGLSEHVPIRLDIGNGTLTWSESAALRLSIDDGRTYRDAASVGTSGSASTDGTGCVTSLSTTYSGSAIVAGRTLSARGLTTASRDSIRISSTLSDARMAVNTTYRQRVGSDTTAQILSSFIADGRRVQLTTTTRQTTDSIISEYRLIGAGTLREIVSRRSRSGAEVVVVDGQTVDAAAARAAFDEITPQFIVGLRPGLVEGVTRLVPSLGLAPGF